MNIQISARHFECEQEIQQEIEQRIERLAKTYLEPVHVDVVLDKEDNRFRVQIVMHNRVQAEATAEDFDLMTAFNKTFDKVERQLKKFKEKIKHHKGKKAVSRKYREMVVDARGIEDIDSSPQVIEEKPYIVKPMSVDEAIMQMELLHADFYVFINQENEQLNIVYKRKDGNYGHINI